MSDDAEQEKDWFLCRICGVRINKCKFEYDTFGNLEFWSCHKCKCDRIGIWKLERAGYNAFETHAKLDGREGYKGVNMDTVESVIAKLRAIDAELFKKGDNDG